MIGEKLKCVVPYNTHYSKNKKYYAQIRGSFRVIRKEYRTASHQLLSLFNNSFTNHPFKDQEKLWVKIYAHRPDFKSDIQNFEECICDALKESIKIDDRYYSLIIDWELNRKDPKIEIEIWQGDL